MTLKDKEEDVQNNVIVVSGWKKSNDITYNGLGMVSCEKIKIN